MLWVNFYQCHCHKYLTQSCPNISNNNNDTFHYTIHVREEEIGAIKVKTDKMNDRANKLDHEASVLEIQAMELRRAADQLKGSYK